MTYAIWDQQSANLVGDFDSEGEALAFVSVAIKSNSNIALGWALTVEDDNENVRSIAAGRDLLLRVMRPQPEIIWQSV
ncbi:MAG: hypothetical protein AB7R89_23055 [Dehalococcoidia bacterium]